MIGIGEPVRIATAIYDDGADHHPPGYLARAGEVVIVRSIFGNALDVSHPDVLDSSFLIYEGEYEAKP